MSGGDRTTVEDAPLVFVTVGTDHHPFRSLIAWIDEWLAHREGPDVRCLVQHGTAPGPRSAAGVEILPFERVNRLVEEAAVVVCQGGPGSVALARSKGKRPIVVPRTRRRGEHVDDHQVTFAQRLDRDGRAICAPSPALLAVALDRALVDPGWLTIEPEDDRGIAETVERFAAIADQLLEAGAGSRPLGRLTARWSGPSR